MIRIGIFWLLGSLMGFGVLICRGGITGMFISRYENLLPVALLITLPLVLIAGLVPSMITAAFDRMLDRRGERGIAKFVFTGICGYAAAYILVVENAFETTPFFPQDAKWGLVGLIPAIACSWLMEKINDLQGE